VEVEVEAEIYAETVKFANRWHSQKHPQGASRQSKQATNRLLSYFQCWLPLLLLLLLR